MRSSVSSPGRTSRPSSPRSAATPARRARHGWPARGRQDLAYRILGSTTAYRMSAIRLPAIVAMVTTKVTPSSVGRSSLKAELMASRPMPGS